MRRDPSCRVERPRCGRPTGLDWACRSSAGWFPHDAAYRTWGATALSVAARSFNGPDNGKRRHSKQSAPIVLHVLKPWAAWPKSTRWVVSGVIAAVVALGITWALFVPAASWLAHLDVGSAKGLPLQAARDAAQGRLLTL